MPAISIVTPSLNQAHFAGDMLRSLEEQTYPDLEHVIFDACSTDGSVELWREWEWQREKAENLKLENGKEENAETGNLKLEGAAVIRVRVFVEADRGQSDAINKGMRVATGEIVGWLNADDVLIPGALHTVVRAFAEHPEAVVVYGVGAKSERDGSIRRKVPFRPFSHRRLRHAFGAVQPAMFFKREAFWRVGGLDESLHYAMDWDLLLKLAQVGEVVAIQEHLANIRYYEETKTNTGGWKRMEEIARIARRHNGAWDRNVLSFRIRDVLARQPLSWPRTLFDHLCWNLFKDPPLMVQGWPEE